MTRHARVHTCSQRRCCQALLGLFVPLLALWPCVSWAACGVQDPGGCVDAAMYSFWYGLAGLGWSIDRTLLLLAYQLDTFRWWLVEVAFSSAYQVLVQIIDPLILPFATLAVIVGCLAFLLLPLFGRTRLVNIRHALVWTVLAPLLLSLSGPMIVQLEQLRSSVGSALFDGVSAIAPGAIFGATARDMRAPTPLYPANPCGSGTLARQTLGGLRMDDLAAAMLWADAEDIHCPDRGGPSEDIPDLFFEAAPTGPGYARDEDVSQMDAGNDRTQAVQNMQRGAIRTFLGILPSILAVLDALVQLVFSLCMIALWIGLPIGLVFVFFEQTASGVTGLLRRVLSVLQVSWSSSVLLGIVAACLIAAAELRNAAAYTGFAIGGIVLTAYMLIVAVDTLKSCIRTLNDTVATATGLSVTRPFEFAGEAAATAVGVGAAVATGGAATALTAAAAWQQTGSGRYAASAAVGRIKPIAQLGEVAAAMGWLQDEEVRDGLYAGYRSAVGTWRGTRLQMAADAKRSDAQGRTFHDRAQERALDRQLARAEHPTVVQEIGDLAASGRGLYAYVGSGQIAKDVYRAGERIPEAARVGWQRVQGAWRSFDADVTEHSARSQSPIRRGLATVQVLDDRLRPGRRGAVISLNEQGHVRYDDPPETPPGGAINLPRSQVRVPRLLMLGYAVQAQGDTVTFWKPGGTAAADERQTLVKAGALIGDAARSGTRATSASPMTAASGAASRTAQTTHSVSPPGSAIPAAMRTHTIQDYEAAVRQIEAQITSVQQELEQLDAASQTEQAAATRRRAQERLDQLQRVKVRAEARLDAMRRQTSEARSEDASQGGTDA